VGAAHGRWWLVLAAGAFWIAWLLMPGVGVTDAGRIFELVGQARTRVLASSALQLASAACYAPALVALASGARAHDPGLRLAATSLLVGAMGSAADAVFHLFAYEMTAPGAPRAALLPVMARMQGPGLAWILPMIACFFLGTGLLLRAALRAGPAPGARRVWLGLGALAALLLGLATAGRIGAGRAVGLCVLALLSASQLRAALSPLFDGAQHGSGGASRRALHRSR
jgi:hypothetical protein